MATPHAGWSRSEESETLRFGQRLRLGRSEWSVGSEFSDDSRSYSAGYGYRLGSDLDLTLEATRREAANEETADHRVMVRAGMRW